MTAALASPPEQKARHLLSLLKQHSLRAKLERSFRLTPGLILPNRLLITFPKSQLGPDPLARLSPLALDLAIPPASLDEAARYLPITSFLHLGFEEGPAHSLYKLYLEFARPQDSLDAVETDDPIPRYLAFKWDPDNPSASPLVSRYLQFPPLSTRALFDRLDAILPARSLAPALEAAREVLRLALDRLPALEIPYIEVLEPGSPRRSFDLNLYDAALKVADLDPILRKLSAHFQIPETALSSVLDRVSAHHLGHLAAGLHRSGEPFFTIYHNEYVLPNPQPRSSPARPTFVPVSPPASSASHSLPKRLEPTQPTDLYRNYCLWPYEPIAPTDGKLRAVSLLHHSFELAGLADEGARLVETLRAAIGPFQTVWGVKWLDNQLSWEFYFYDYNRLERSVSVSRVLDALRPLVLCALPIDEKTPYFMFSLDFNAQILQNGLDVIHLYLGNPGSTVSSGVSYAQTASGRTLENVYFFFDAATQLPDVSRKVRNSAYVLAQEIPPDALLWPDLRHCRTICVANKRSNDTLYFAGVTVPQLLGFLTRLDYPHPLVEFLRASQHQFDHLLFDVGFDYTTEAGRVHLLKSGFYGVF